MKAEPNVAPLVDIVLVLLIIFMVLTPILRNGYDTALTTQKVSPTHAANGIQVVQISEKTCLINQQPVELDRLQNLLHQVMKSSGEKRIYFDASESLKYGVALKTIDLLHTMNAEIGVITSEESLHDESTGS